MPPKVCCTPSVWPTWRPSDSPATSEVVAGKRSAVPTGTRMTTTARLATCVGIGSSASPPASDSTPSRRVRTSPSRLTIGPRSSPRISSDTPPT